MASTIVVPVIEGTFGRRGDHWVAKIPRLGVFAYGATLPLAQRRAQLAANLLLSELDDKAALLRLDNAGIPYRVEDDNEPKAGEWSTSTVLGYEEMHGRGGGLAVLA